MSELCFISGGARSGKSTFAEAKALGLTDERGRTKAAYLATGVAMDREFALRIAHHRAQRDPRFNTVEESLDLVAGLRRAVEACGPGNRLPVALLECVSTWLGNVFHELPEAEREPFALAQADGLLSLIEGPVAVTLIVVTNEIGMGIVPVDAYTRQYRDIHGRVNHRLAAASDEAWLLMSGLPLRLK